MKKIIGFILLIILFILGMLQSCKVSEQKKIDKAMLVMANHPNDFAGLAGTLYPPKTEYVKGKDSITIKTEYVKGDSIKCPDVVKPNGEVVKGEKIKCPDSRIEWRDRWRVDTLKTSNTARELFLANALIKMDKELTKTQTLLTEAKNASNKKNWWIGAFAFLFIGAIFVMWKTR